MAIEDSFATFHASLAAAGFYGLVGPGHGVSVKGAAAYGFAATLAKNYISRGNPLIRNALDISLANIIGFTFSLLVDRGQPINLYTIAKVESIKVISKTVAMVVFVAGSLYLGTGFENMSVLSIMFPD